MDVSRSFQPWAGCINMVLNVVFFETKEGLKLGWHHHELKNSAYSLHRESSHCVPV